MLSLTLPGDFIPFVDLVVASPSLRAVTSLVLPAGPLLCSIFSSFAGRRALGPAAGRLFHVTSPALHRLRPSPATFHLIFFYLLLLLSPSSFPLCFFVFSRLSCISAFGFRCILLCLPISLSFCACSVPSWLRSRYYTYSGSFCYWRYWPVFFTAALGSHL